MENKLKMLDVVKAEGEGLPRIVITTGAVDRDNEILDPAGMISANFLKNPVLLLNHDMWGLPIGKVEELKQIANGWDARPSFVDGSVYPLAGTCAAMYRDGFLRAASIRFRPLEWINGDMGTEGYARKYTKWELLEVSLVTVPANQEALQSGKAAGVRAWIKSIEAALGSDPKTDTTPRKNAEVGSAEHSQAAAGATLSVEPDAAAGSFSDPDDAKSGAELSKKNRARLRANVKRLRECHDDLEDLLAKWADPEEDPKDGKSLHGEPPAQDTPETGETRKTGTADGDTDIRRLAQAIREAAGK